MPPPFPEDACVDPPGGAPFDVHSPFLQHLGFVLEQAVEGQARVGYQPQPQHLNSFAVVHGGACMTLLDAAMASAARSARPGMGVVTLELKTSFMQPAAGPLQAQARVLHSGASLAFVQATVFDAAQQACAHATGTFKYLRRLPTSAARANELSRG